MSDIINLLEERRKRNKKVLVEYQTEQYTPNDEQEERRARIREGLLAELQQRVRDLEADVQDLAAAQQRTQQRMLLLIKHILFNPNPAVPEDV